MFRSLSFALLISAAPPLRAQQVPPPPPLPHDSIRGAVRTVDVRSRTLEVVSGVGYALRVVRLELPPDVPIAAVGVATLALGDLKPGDIVEATFGSRATPTRAVVYSIRRVGRMETGTEQTP